MPSPLDPPVAVVLLGAGRWGRNLLRQFRNTPRAQVVALVDPDPIARQTLAQQMDLEPEVALLDDWQQIWALPQVDAVVVATPASTHGPIIQAALQRRCPVLAEKPLTLSASSAQALWDLAQRQQCPLVVDHTYSFHAAVLSGRMALLREELGAIRYGYGSRTHLGPVRSDVDVLWDLAIHDLCIFNHWLGCVPIGVMAQGLSWLRPAASSLTSSTDASPSSPGSRASNLDRPRGDRLGSDRASRDRLGSDRSGADRSGSDRLGSDRSGSDRSGSDRLGSDRDHFDRLGSDRPNRDRAPQSPPTPPSRFRASLPPPPRFQPHAQADHVWATVVYPPQIPIQFQWGWANAHRQRQSVLVGDRGSLVLDELAPRSLVLHQGHLEQDPADRWHPQGNLIHPLPVANRQALTEVCEHFLDCVLQKKQSPRSSGREAVVLLMLLEALGQSLEQGGRWVAIEGVNP